MSVVSKDDAVEMNAIQRKYYCEWCWYKSYGNCHLCSIYPTSINFIPVKESILK